MKRWAWNLFCLFSLLVFVLSVTLWVRSYFVGDALSWTDWNLASTQPVKKTKVQFSDATLSRGVIFFRRGYQITERGGRGTKGWELVHGAPVSLGDPSTEPRIRMHFRFANLQVASFLAANAHARIEYDIVLLPLWLFLPAAIPPILWWRRSRKNRGRGFPVLTTSSTEP